MEVAVGVALGANETDRERQRPHALLQVQSIRQAIGSAVGHLDGEAAIHTQLDPACDLTW